MAPINTLIQITWNAHELGPHDRYKGSPIASGTKVFSIDGASLDEIKVKLQDIINMISEKTNGANGTTEGLGESQVPGVQGYGAQGTKVFAMRGVTGRRNPG